eukprot:TRINITY_DN69616_c0_g1_i1.p1 TRINITY_DN69616_c0_g1~~TRINITY_DN69616_c0_g1_i1.p1  ORF type:complete len:453 (+),score=125.38 TRINITY_DN69616_c0_g1_i1:149-1507(+)
MSGLPPGRLPAVPESSTLSDSIGESQELGNVSAPEAPPSGEAKLEEEDLFGSDIELDTGAAEFPIPPSMLPTVGLGFSASEGTRSPALPTVKSDIGGRGSMGSVVGSMVDEDLFGDEDFDDKHLFGSDDENDIDEKELFGDVDDEDQKVTPKSASPAPPQPGSQQEVQGSPAAPTPSEVFSEMDEREIFGDVSDDEEPEKEGSVILLRRPAPTKDRPINILRLPNVLSIEKSAFNPKALGHELVEGYREGENTQGNHCVQLLTPENCIRWRFKKGLDGQILTDEDGRPQYESNGRIVEWEDGSKTLYVGAEAFPMSEIRDKVVLFEENSQDVHVCHGVMHSRFVATPNSLETETHERLKRSQYRKYEPTRRTLLMSAEEQADAQQLLQLEAEQKKRQEKQLKKQKKETAKRDAKAAAIVGVGGAITKDFLEDDAADAGVGASIKDIKRGRIA